MTEPAMTFSSQEEALLKRSFAQVSADPLNASRIFYNHLFQAAPETRGLFLNDMARQGDKLIATLSSVILQIGNLSGLKPTIEELGLRHVAYGVQPEHYHATGAALFRMLEDVLGEGYSPETQAPGKKPTQPSRTSWRRRSKTGNRKAAALRRMTISMPEGLEDFLAALPNQPCLNPVAAGAWSPCPSHCGAVRR